MRTLRHLCVILTLISFPSTDGEFSSAAAAFQSQHRAIPASSGNYQQHESESAAVAEARGAEGCKFPSKWEGSWFQSGGGSDTAISITRTTINTKGRCLEADGEKYLIHNERESCYRCVVFHEKHYNVLQYKETFCVPERRAVKDICSTISGDANLLAMFRLDAVPIECPFSKGPFTFTYNRGQRDCRYPASTVEPCIQNSRVLLNFQACPDVTGTESKAEELQCLAIWKEGSSRFLLGLIKYNHPASFEERFRCFVYEKTKKLGSGGSASQHGNGTDNVIFRLAQSGDATCNGLSLHEYSRMMTLRKAPSTKPCQFPSWLQSHAQWHTLDQRSTFVFDSSLGLRVYNSSDLSGVGPNSLTMTAMCSQILENPTLDKVMLILHSTSDCMSGYICAAIYKRDGHIVELQLGNTARRADDACHIHYFNQSQLPYVTLVSSTPETRQCPNVGRFQVTGFMREGRQLQGKCSKSFDSLSVGCNSLDTLQLRSECYSSDLTAEYACHGTWEEMGVSYLIATPLSRASTTSRRYCFVFRETSTDFSLQQRLKSSGQFRSIGQEETGLDLDGSEGLGYGRLLQFSSVADSCRRNIVPGIEGSIAFNVTENGRCDDFSGVRSILFSVTSYQNVILVLVGLFLGN